MEMMKKMKKMKRSSNGIIRMKPLIFSMFVATMLFGNTRTERYVGTAVDLKTGKLIYTEEHEATYKGEVHVGSVITYKDGQSAVIGKKEISFQEGSPVAAFRREDYRFGTVESAMPNGSGIRMLKKENASSEEQSEVIALPSPAAVDAGLNNLVRNNWDRLLRNEKVTFNLGVPSQLDYFEFRVVKEREEGFVGRKAVVVRFESDHWFIRLFVDPVVVWYDAETRRAVKYEGISNLYNEEGKSYVVRVTFDKPGP